MSERDRSVLRGFVSILSGNFGGVLIALAVTPLLVRALGSSQYGDYAFVLSTVSVLVVLTNAGISDGVRKFIAEARDEGWEPYVFGFYARLAVALALLAGLLLFVAVRTGVVAALVGPAFSEYFLLLAVLVGARQLFLTFRSTLMGLGLEHYSEPLTVLQKALFGVFGVALAWLGYGVTGVLVGHIFASGLATIVALGVLSFQLELGAVLRSSGTNWTVTGRDLLSFNGLSVVLTLLMMSLYHVDILLLRPLAGSQVTGYYRAALLVAEFVWFVPFALQMALLQSTSELWADGQVEEISALATRVTRYTLALTLIVTIGIAALVDAFVPLYFGTEFAVASEIVLLLLPGAFGLAVARPIFAIGQAKGELRVLVAATGTAAVVNFVLNLALIPRYGMYGAAVATSIGYGSMFFLHVVSARRLGFDPVSDLRLGRLLAAGGITALPVIWLSRRLASPLIVLIIVPPIGGVVFAMLILRFRVIPVHELEPVVERAPVPADNYLKRMLDLMGP